MINDIIKINKNGKPAYIWKFKNGDPRKYLILSDWETKLMFLGAHLELDESPYSCLDFDDCMALISPKWPIKGQEY